MKCGICVCGLNGSGKTTLAGALAKELNFKHMDIEQYYFTSADNPYSSSRTREEVERALKGGEGRWHTNESIKRAKK